MQSINQNFAIQKCQEYVRMRLSRKLTDVVAEVRIALEAEFGVTDEMIAGYRRKVDSNGHEFHKEVHRLK